MLDRRLRPLLDPPLAHVAARVDHPGVTPDRLTVAGLVLGLAGAAAAAAAWWAAALGLWLVSRLADGLDGALARRRRSRTGTGLEDGEGGGAGGFLDVTADFTVYGTFVVGVGIGSGEALLPFLLVLLAYYVNGTAFLAFSSVAERTGRRQDDGRSLSFLGGLAEGAETVAVHALWCVLPFWAAEIAWGWAAVVGASAVQRVVVGYRALRG